VNGPYIKAEQSHLQSSEKTNTEIVPEISENTSMSTGWTQFYQASAMHNWILLDNQSSTTIFCNSDIVNNICNTDETLSLTTNAGVLTTNKKADLPGCGEV
jgi:hypothetical protein